MKMIIDFYKSLDTLNLIIFWGIIIVIILLLIFSFIMINKNKKLKKIIHETNKQDEELPIKTENIIVQETFEEKQQLEPETIEIPVKEEIIFEEKTEIKEEIKTNEPQDENPKTNEITQKAPIEMPTGPYQRNVLREMSLSQTSPIGITRPTIKEDKKIELARDLTTSLDEDKKEDEMTYLNVKTLIENDRIQKEQQKKLEEELNKDTKKQENAYIHSIQPVLSKEPIEHNKNTEKSSSEKYLEEVSRKLSEAEIPDEIERTEYELEQEENAIISYKELMEKKDSIQTVDEEEAIISIEELMNRKKEEEITLKQEENKLYNINDSEDNDDFIKELKEFRKDL